MLFTNGEKNTDDDSFSMNIPIKKKEKTENREKTHEIPKTKRSTTFHVLLDVFLDFIFLLENPKVFPPILL